jgi:hypothetical protein
MRALPVIPSINIVDCIVEPTDCARNIGVIFDKHLSLRQHISSVVCSANIGIRNIGRIRKYLSCDVARIYTQHLVTSRLEFCNALLIGLPDVALHPLQRVQNTAARLVVKARKSAHITPILHELHWLPFRQRIRYKVSMFTFKALHHLVPSYISERILVKDHSRVLQSTNSLQLGVPMMSIPSYGDWAFSVAAPKIWNDLPAERMSLCVLGAS